ncbi:unnamed protein product [Fusarium fujikuroi]|nr:unnamed protein product [Fusarium fujikuroi]
MSSTAYMPPCGLSAPITIVSVALWRILKLAGYKKIKLIRKPRLTVYFFIAAAAIAFRGSLKSDFSIAIFIRDRKALFLETLKEKKATKKEYKKERLNIFI